MTTPSGDLAVLWWAIHPTTGARVALPDVVSWTLSPVLGSPGAVSLNYPAHGLNFATLDGFVTEKRDLEVEIWFRGRVQGALRGILCEKSGDLVEAGAVWSFGGHFLEHLMSQIVVAPHTPDAKRETVFSAATPGAVMATLMQRAHARGTAVDVGYTSFSTTVDSNGAAWNRTVTATLSPVNTTYLQVLDDLVEQGACEWEITPDHQLRLYVAGTRGVDRTVGANPVVLRRGRNLTDVPSKVSSREGGTDLWGVGGEGLYHLEFDATARATRGRQVERAFSANGVTDLGALDALTTAKLAAVTGGVREVTHGVLFGAGDPLPLSGFHVGDWVYSNPGKGSTGAGGGNERLRIKQWSLSRAASREYTGTITLNDLYAEQLVQLQRRLAALQGGKLVVGTSNPGSSTVDVLAPAAPTGLTASSIAYQDDAHSQTLAAVTLAWSPVTTNAAGPSTETAQAAQLILDRMQSGLSIAEDWTWVGAPPIVGKHNDTLLAGYEASGSTDAQAWLAGYVAANSAGATATDDVAGYKVQLAYLGLSQVGGIPSSNPVDQVIAYNDVTPSTGISATSFTFGGVEGGASIGLRVAAFDSSGNQSAWSVPLAHTASNDNTPPPVPSTPTARNFLRQLIVEWNGLGSAGEVMPRDFDYVEAHASTASNFAVTAGTLFDRMYGEGGVVFDSGSYVGTVFFKLVSVDRSGNKSVASAQASATPSRALADDIGDQIITAAKMADGQPLGPKIGSEQISTPHLTVATFSDNLLPNGGFEDVELTSALPASWALATSSGGTNTYTRTTVAADVFSGAAAAQVVMSAASGRLDIRSDSLPTKPGDNWYFELSAKASRALAGVTVYVGVGTVDQPTVAYPANWVYPFLGTPALATTYPAAPFGFNYTVPPTVGSGVVPKYLRLYLYFGNVVGDAAAVTFHADEVRARKVVGTAEIQDAAISRAKIGLLQVGDGQFESASVGKFTSGTMTATVTNSGLFRTASSGNRVEFDSAGIRLFMGTTVVGNWQTSDASMLMTGTYQSGLSGERINILPDGSMVFYPASGTNASRLSNFGNDLMIRGILNVDGRSGRINANALGVGMNFSAESEIPSNLRAEVVVLDRRVRATAPLITLELNGKLATTDGAPRRVLFQKTDVNGAVELGSRIEYKLDSISQPGMTTINQDAGWKGEGGIVLIVNAALGAFQRIKATDFLLASGQAVKDDIELTTAVLDPLATIRAAPGRKFRYRAEKAKDPVGAPVHFGVLAEDLPEVLRRPAAAADGSGPEPSIGVGSQLGVMWAAFPQLADLIQALTARVDDIETRTPPPVPKMGAP